MSRKRSSDDLSGGSSGSQKRPRAPGAADSEESQSSDESSTESRAPSAMMEIAEEVAAQSSSSAAVAVIPPPVPGPSRLSPVPGPSRRQENGNDSSGNSSSSMDVAEEAAQGDRVVPANIVPPSLEEWRASIVIPEDPFGDNTSTRLSSEPPSPRGTTMEQTGQAQADIDTAISTLTDMSTDSQCASREPSAQTRRTSFSGCLQEIQVAECSKTAYSSQCEPVAEEASESGENVAGTERVSESDTVTAESAEGTEPPRGSGGPSESSEGASSTRRTKRPSVSQDDVAGCSEGGQSEGKRRRSEIDDNAP